MATYNTGLTILDITDPQSMNTISVNPVSDYTYAVQVSGNYAYLANGEAGIITFDVTDTSNPVDLGNTNTPGYAYDIKLQNNYLYVANSGNFGLRVLDVTDPTSIYEISYLSGFSANTVDLLDNYIFVNGLYHIIDISNPYTPELLFDGGGGVKVSSISTYYLHLKNNRLDLIDLSNPSSPATIEYYDISGEAKAIAVDSPYIYVGGDFGLIILELVE